MKHKVQLPARFKIYFLILINLLVISCKKELELPVAPEQPGIPEVTVPSSFSHGSESVFLMGAHNTLKSNPLGAIHSVGSGIASNPIHAVIEPLKEIGEVIWEIYDYEHVEAQFDQVKEKLDTLSDKIDEVVIHLSSLEDEMDLQFADLISFFQTENIKNKKQLIDDQMIGGTANDFMFFVNMAAFYQKDTIRYASQRKALSQEVTGWAWDLYKSNDMEDSFVGLANELLPDAALGSQSAMYTYVNKLIPLLEGKVADSTSAMNAYMLLEDYFLYLIGYQFQAATVQMNAAKMVDTTGMGLDSIFWHADVVTKISQEIKIFQDVVDYYVANIAEYRTNDRFRNDMKYRESGLAPDKVFYHVFARSQFVSNLLSSIIGVPYPKVAGHIMVPKQYLTDRTKPITVGLVNFMNISYLYELTATGVADSSVIPYTVTANGKCNPGYTWYSYRLGTTDNVAAGNPLDLTLVDNSSTTFPWLHNAPITGYITPLYYNPNDPSQVSKTLTDDCYFEFGYFSANWQWGKLLSNTIIDDSWHKTVVRDVDLRWFYIYNYNSTIKCGDQSPQVPMAVTTDKYGNLYFQTADITFSNVDQLTGHLEFSGMTSSTDHYYIVTDGNYATINTGDAPPKSGGVEAFACYDVCYGMQGTGGSDITVKIGTKREDYMQCSHYFLDNGSDLVGINWHNQAGIWNHGFGTTALAPNTSYEPGILYYYQTYGLPSKVPASINFSAAFQFVYTGWGMHAGS